MTTPWIVPGDMWAGETVAVMGCGPSLTQEVADSLKQYKRVVCNHAHLLAPDADMLVGLDSNWSQGMREFYGIRVCGVVCEELDAKYIGHMHEVVQLSPQNIVHIMDTGLAAIRIAAMTGATRILLAGFDPEQAANFSGYPEPSGHHQHVEVGLSAMIAELQARGIAVEKIKVPAKRRGV